MTVQSVNKAFPNWSWLEAQSTDALRKKLSLRAEKVIDKLAVEAISSIDLPRKPYLPCKLLECMSTTLLISPLGIRLLDALQKSGLFSSDHETSRKEIDRLIEEALEAGNDVLAIALINRCQSTNMAHLLTACEHGRIQAIIALMNNGLDINLNNDEINNNPPLHQAMRFNQTETAKFLLQHGAIVDRRDEQEMTALHIASFELSTIGMKLVIDAGADVNAQNKFGNTPLHYAYKSKHAVSLLINSNAKPDIANELGKTPLHEAAVNGIEGAEGLLNKGANPLIEDNAGKTSIDLAIDVFDHPYLKLVFKAHLIMRLIIQDARHYNWRKKFLDSASLMANDLHMNPLEVAFLLKFDSELSQALVSHMSQERILNSFAQLVLKYPAYLDRLLLLACKTGHVESVKSLITYGANVNTHCFNKITPLHIACRDGNFELARLLLTNKASANSKNDEGFTPLHLAVKNGFLSVVELLLSHHADCNLVDKDKKTPLHFCTNPQIVHLLLNAGSFLEIQDKEGNTPLNLACGTSNEGTACALYKAGASLLVKNQNGLTATQIAMQKNCRVFLSDVFASFGYIQGLLDSLDDISNLDSELIKQVDFLMNPQAVDNRSTPLEVGLLLQNSSLVSALLSKMTLWSIENAYRKLTEKYPLDMQFLQDCRNSINKDHMLKGADMDIDIPAGPEIDISTMLEMFDKINFTNRAEPGYRSEKLLKDDGNPATVSHLKNGLNILITKTKKQESHLAVPEKNRQAFYEKLERLLKHIGHALNTSTDLDTKASVLIDLAVAGCHCGIRWMSESHQFYNLVCKKLMPLTLEDRLLGLLRRSRLGFIMEFTEGNPHHYNYILAEIGMELGLTGAETLQGYNDSFYHGSKTKQEFLDKFNSFYTSSKIIDMSKEEIESLYNEFESRDLIVDWFIENIPEDWGNDEFGSVQRSVQRRMLQKDKEEDVLQMLKKRHIYVERGKSPLKAIHIARVNEYLAREVFEQTSEGEPTNKFRRDAVIKMLLKLNILQGVQHKKTTTQKKEQSSKRVKHKHDV